LTEKLSGSKWNGRRLTVRDGPLPTRSACIILREVTI